ncbi:peptidoglycan bridge formation glycyltransferase FemA/FemB family protein [Candidatus Peregrinibacteria bacterium]|nr:peptidoglycan bridge formation glycyltransferase FemA/FemB family protein [Candidatus Peregrinibacteria bacterium]
MATARVITSPEDLKKYDHWVKNHPHGNLWQSLEWKEYQETLGRETQIYVVEDSSTPSPLPSPSAFAKATADRQGGGKTILASALVIIDRTIFGLSTWDIPRGPLSNSTLPETIIRDAKKDKCISLYISPVPPLQTTNHKLQTSQRHEQPEATRIVDLTKTHDEILAQMKSKGRYNIHVAEKYGVEVRESQDIDTFYNLLKGTSDRDRFKHLSQSHYKTFLEHLPGAFLLLAFLPSQKKPVAGLMGVCWNMQGIYYYGASNYAYRATMAPYLLQWETMKRCKEQGCGAYDLMGISSDPTHPWAGVSRFKEQFGGKVVEYPHEQEMIFMPLIKKILTAKRRYIG